MGTVMVVVVLDEWTANTLSGLSYIDNNNKRRQNLPQLFRSRGRRERESNQILSLLHSTSRFIRAFNWLAHSLYSESTSWQDQSAKLDDAQSKAGQYDREHVHEIVANFCLDISLTEIQYYGCC